MATKKATTKTTAKTTAKKTSAKTATKVESKVEAVTNEVTEQANTVLETLSKNFDNAQGLAKQAWFAYLGVFGRSFEEIQTRVNTTGDDLRARYAQMSEDRQKLVEDLVSRGEKVQDDAEVLLKESRANIEEQIEVAKNRLSGLVSVVDIPARLQDMSDRLESLSKDLKKSA